jgi:histidinol phosphatase-like PHP family hydrolase
VSSSGAKFIRADLHIHSYGQDGSYDVNDAEMTPEKIVDEALKANLGIISITDHNEILNSQKAIQYSYDKSITIIPGIEVNTIQGHLLAYFETINDLRKFYGKLIISDDKSRCNQGLKQCLDIIEDHGGIGILAHIELSSGFERTIGRFSPVMDEVFCHKSLYGLEISMKDSFNLFTEEDDNEERKRMIRLRRNQTSFSGNLSLPKVMFSDAHSIESFGKNASGASKLTRIKIEEKMFHGLKIAFLNHESRIRIEETIPENIPYFTSMSIDGGILDKQDINFSKNLTCIIGGRGAGKSTLLESLRVASGNNAENNLVDCEIWPDEINLQYIDETEYVSEFRRLKNSSVENTTDASFGLEKVKIESYGQGETTATIQNSDNDPSHLLRFLDNFIDIKVLQKEDEEICELLYTNRVELQKLRIELISEKEYSRALRDLENKKTRLERENVGDLVRYHTALQVERNLRKNVADSLTSLVKTYRASLEDVEELKSIGVSDENAIIIGKNEYIQVKQIINDFSIIVKEKNKEISEILDEKVALLQKIMANWKNQETAIYEKIDIKKQELIAQGIPFDISKINQLAEDIESYREKITKCNQIKQQINILEEERKQLIEKRKMIRKNIYKERYIFAKRINENLMHSVDGLYVKIEFNEGCFSPDFEEHLKKTMGWHTTQVNRARIIARRLSPLLFSSYVKNGKREFLKNIVNKDRIY